LSKLGNGDIKQAFCPVHTCHRDEGWLDAVSLFIVAGAGTSSSPTERSELLAQRRSHGSCNFLATYPVHVLLCVPGVGRRSCSSIFFYIAGPVGSGSTIKCPEEIPHRQP